MSMMRCLVTAQLEPDKEQLAASLCHRLTYANLDRLTLRNILPDKPCWCGRLRRRKWAKVLAEFPPRES